MPGRDQEAHGAVVQEPCERSARGQAKHKICEEKHKTTPVLESCELAHVHMDFRVWP